MAIQEGQKFGNYKVLSRLGVGGMGAVYLAEHPLIGKKVALKAIHPEFAHNKEVVTRFFNEARAVNKIGNEHIVEIHDFGQGPDGEDFFIMEYLQGPTLAAVLQAERVLQPQRALHICAQIAAGLAAAHACGIIHRDLKPDNIMLVPRLGDRDFVKILDFGLAKMFADASTKLTAQGVVLGTPQYMAPEMCESKQDIDHRSDIYALGVLLFQMLCGQVPFDGNTMGEVLVKHVSQPVPAPRGFNPAIPPSVEQIILRCLAKKRDDRFGTMKELRTALLDSDRYLASSPPVIPSASSAAANTVFGQNQQPAPQGAAPQAGGQAAAAHYPRPGSHGVGGALPPGAPPPAVSPAQLAAAAPAQTMLADGQPLPLKPPPPSIVNAPMVAAAGAQTAFIPAQSGAVPAAHPANGSGAIPVGAKTAFMDGASMGFGQAPAMPERTISAVPELNPPTAPVNMTMVIGTPEGYSDKPPTKKWPLLVGLFSVLAVVGAGVAAFVFPGFLNNKTDNSQPSSAVARMDAGTASVADAAPKAVVKQPPVTTKADAQIAKLKTVKVRFDTSIKGAKVYAADGKLLCKTPCDLLLPDDGKPHVVTLKHPRAKTRTKTIIPSAGLEMKVDMERTRRKRPTHRRIRRPRKPGKKPTGKVGDGAHVPDF